MIIQGGGNPKSLDLDLKTEQSDEKSFLRREPRSFSETNAA